MRRERGKWKGREKESETKKGRKKKKKDTVSPRSCIKPGFIFSARLGKKQRKNNIGDEDKTTANFIQCFWRPPSQL